MSGRILSTIGLVASATLLASGIAFGVADTAHAENCLTAPNSSAPQGSHWYYHLDQANQRKCWYVRTRGQPAQQVTAPATSEAVPVEPSHAIPKPTDSSAGAPTLIGPSDVAPPLPHAEMLAAEPRSMPASTAMNKLVDASAQEEITAASIPEAAASQASELAQTVPHSDGPAPAAPLAWSDASPLVATVKAPESIAAPIDARADSGPKSDARASDDAQSAARGTEPTTRARMAVSLIKPTPTMFLILGLGLAVIGILSRMVLKIAVARRARVNQRRDECRDNQDEYSFVYERLSSARDFGPHQAYRARDDAPAVPDLSVSPGGLTGLNNARDKNESSKRDDTLAQLNHGLDWLLQSERADRPLPSRKDRLSTVAASFQARKRVDGQAQGEALRNALGLV